MGHPSNIQISQAVCKDAEQIERVLAAAFAEYKECYTPRAFEATTPSHTQILARLSEGPIWVARYCQSVVGTVSGRGSGKEFYIRSMAVLPRFSGIGVGMRLLQTVHSYALARGCGHMRLSTTRFLPAAIHLYRRFGFREIDDDSVDLFGTPLIQMKKSLVHLHESCTEGTVSGDSLPRA